MRRRLGQRYEIGEAIGSGATSTVHLGRLLGTAGFTKTIAIKRLHAHLAADETLRAILIDEARLVSRISHPNVVAVLDVAEEGGEVFLALEYVRGATLAELLAASPVPAALAVTIMRDALAGLHAAHHARDAKGASLELVHRDVSPRNVVATTDGVGKILDFGIAKARARASTTREGHVRGSVPYMAPEQIRDEALTPRTDVYAASVVLWEALTGTRLFQGESEAAVLQKILDHDVKPPSAVKPELPRALDAVVLKGLASDPAERFATGLEMAVALEQSLAPATSAEVAAWVSKLREPELRAREERLDRDEPPHDEKVESTSPPIEVVTRTPAPAGAERSRGGPWVAAALTLVIVIVAIVAFGRRSETASSAPAAAALPVVVPPPSSAIPSSSSSSVANEAPRAVASPSIAAVAQPPAPRAAAPSLPPSLPPSAAVSAAVSAARPECRPYYVDDAGVRRFNRECLQ